MGDMDFKVAGTRNGICAMQMDIKIKGVSREILSEALAQAKKARMQILDVMEAVIPEPRKELSKYAPKIETIMINPEKIKDVIGRGGDMITKIILEASHVKTVQDKDAVKSSLDLNTEKDIEPITLDGVEWTGKVNMITAEKDGTVFLVAQYGYDFNDSLVQYILKSVKKA